MTLSVSAIRNYSPVNYNRNNLQTKEALKAQPSFGNDVDKSGNDMRKATFTVAIPLAALTCLSSCDKDYWLDRHSECRAEATVANDGCCPGCWYRLPIDPDTIVKTDTVHHTDSVYIKDNFKSPVIDTINSMLTTLGDDPSKGYIPVKIAYIDEMDTRYKRNVIDGQSSSPNLIIYKGTASPFDDNQGRFVVGSPLDKHDRWEFTLTRNGNLYATRLIAKDGINNPNYPEDYVLGGDVYVYNHDAANKLIEVFNGGGKFVKSIRPKEGTQNNVEVTNPENTTWNWTNFNVLRADSPEGNN